MDEGLRNVCLSEWDNGRTELGSVAGLGRIPAVPNPCVNRHLDRPARPGYHVPRAGRRRACGWLGRLFMGVLLTGFPASVGSTQSLPFFPGAEGFGSTFLGTAHRCGLVFQCVRLSRHQLERQRAGFPA